jgi:DNA-binding CsgD family transcriptional regulator/tetratricopeptide (TPR) repeat protein
MQPTEFQAAEDIKPLARQVLDAARGAFYIGDFNECLQCLDRVVSPSATERSEMILLRARVLIRTQRFAEVAQMLGPILGRFVTVDEVCTARMLHAAAVARLPDSLERGLALLHEVASGAEALRAHRAIRAEIAYLLAFIYWMKRDYRLVLQYANVAEQAQADVISVRAASLRGYVATAKERYPEALRLFRFALNVYRSCREHDAELVEQLVFQIAALEASLRNEEISGTHTLPEDVGRLGGTSASDIPSVYRMEICAWDAWLFAFDGERDSAYKFISRSEHYAPSPAWRVWALAHKAKISAAFGDVAWGRQFATEGLELSRVVDWNSPQGEERIALLHLAEIIATTDPVAGGDVLDRYDSLTSRIDLSLILQDDVRLWILETFIRGLIQRARGDVFAAHQSFAGVYGHAKRVGLLWRAALALIELDATTIETPSRGEHYLHEAAMLVYQHFPRSFIARRLGPWANVNRDPVAVRLSPQPREVLRHVLTGKNPKEVAAVMGLSEATVKGYLKTLFRAFDVHSTPELLVACYERGIGDPAWWNALDDAAATIARPSLRRRHYSA